MTEPVLTLDGVVAGYGRLTILHGTTLRVRQGTITTMIGPNGAGKSTVFKAVFGLLPIESGTIHFKGEDITVRRPRELLARGVVYVPQGRNLFPELTVRHNLELGGVTMRDEALLRQRIEQVLDRFPMLREKSTRQASTLSGGEQKILELGRGMLLDPSLVLIDEPSIGLAPLMVRQVFDELIRLRDSGVTVLMVEQNARSALAISDDALVLEQGRLALAGRAPDILADPRVGALFLGGGLGETASP
ncbi:MAG: ABC transporter ATP-binding protein [Ectothiorhodospiraceae bacterium]|nr:ABC transporter ATP-binding protein [Ectothiorhodospiraceae bacterium]